MKIWGGKITVPPPSLGECPQQAGKFFPRKRSPSRSLACPQLILTWFNSAGRQNQPVKRSILPPLSPANSDGADPGLFKPGPGPEGRGPGPLLTTYSVGWEPAAARAIPHMLSPPSRALGVGG